MDDFDSARIILSTIAEAIETCQTSSNATMVWQSEKRFCSSLQSTLEDIIACSPTDQGFLYDQEINVLIQAVSQPLPSFYNALAPCMFNPQKSCELHITDEVLAKLQEDMTENVIKPVEALRGQIGKYLQEINTLLLLYIIDFLLSEPLQIVSEEELTDLQDLRKRAKIPALQGLEQLTTLLSIKQSNIEEQQKCLASMRQDVQHYWEMGQATMHGPLDNVTNSSGYVESVSDGISEVSSSRSDDIRGMTAARTGRQIGFSQPHPTDLPIVAWGGGRGELDNSQDENGIGVETESGEDSQQDDSEDEDGNAVEWQDEGDSIEGDSYDEGVETEGEKDSQQNDSEDEDGNAVEWQDEEDSIEGDSYDEGVETEGEEDSQQNDSEDEDGNAVEWQDEEDSIEGGTYDEGVETEGEEDSQQNDSEDEDGNAVEWQDEEDSIEGDSYDEGVETEGEEDSQQDDSEDEDGNAVEWQDEEDSMEGDSYDEGDEGLEAQDERDDSDAFDDESKCDERAYGEGEMNDNNGLRGYGGY